MASPPLFIANLVVNETSSSVTAPPTRQGPCSDSARPGPTPEVILNLPSFGRPVRPRSRSDTPKEDLGERWPQSTSTTVARTKFRGFQHSPWEYGTGRRRPGVLTRSHCRELLRERQKAPHRAFFSLVTGVGLWLGDHPPGDQCPTLGPEGWLRPTVCCQCSNGDVSWRDSARIWRSCQVTRHFASLFPKQRSQSCARLDRCVCVCLDRATT